MPKRKSSATVVTSAKKSTRKEKSATKSHQKEGENDNSTIHRMEEDINEPVSSIEHYQDIWIIGSSLISWAFLAAIELGFTSDLNFDKHKILWQGRRGMRWNGVFKLLKHLLTFIDPPKFLVLHCGANDLGRMKTIELIVAIKRDLKKIQMILPHTKIIWSQMITRIAWKCEGRPDIEKSRARVNSAIAKHILYHHNGGYIKQSNIHHSPDNYRPDGVHLSTP
ncbi:uncharacterized protein LOC134267241, partial [Saccostrea cucullata]|uniref:uncharacterized protein LOC134267241 n=1 Tax=Saccostrea cuccullata TaxID=36930 RepID=UPI002ED10092